MKKNGLRLSLVILLLGFLLRIGLLISNTQANDNHEEVVQFILKTHQLPSKLDCWQCYHPKLYYLTCAIGYKVIHSWVPISLFNVCKFISGIAGFLTIIFCFFFIRQFNLRNIDEALLLGLTILNPDLIGITSQPTNDSFVILFGTITLFAFWMYFQDRKQTWLFCSIIAAPLAAASKGSGLFILFSLLLVLALDRFMCLKKKKPSHPRWAELGLISFFVFLIPITPYYSHSKSFGSPLVVNVNSCSLPNWFEESIVPFAGRTSIFSSFFTFRFFELLKTPYILDTAEIFPLHRTSLWTQIYGRHHFVRFAEWPSSWRSTSSLVLMIGRISLVLGLLPTLFFLKALLHTSKLTFARIVGQKEQKDDGSLVFVITTWSLLLMLVIFSYKYCHYGSMKAIYLYPGILGYLFFLIKGSNPSLKKSTVPRADLLKIIFGLLLISYSLDIGLLIANLSMRFF